MNLEMESSINGDVTVVLVKGDINSATSLEFGRYIKEAIGNSAKSQVVLDMEHVIYMSSAGLREIVAGLKLSQKGGGDMRIAALQERLRMLFDIAGLPSFSKIYPSVDEAVKSFEESE
jgi:anti-sigma B factor antagonist